MMGQDLEDLVIDENVRRDNKKSKGLLTILALLIAILIIVIMMVRTVAEKNTSNVVEKRDEKSIISSELLLDDEDNMGEPKSDNEKLDDMTSIIDNKNISKSNEIKETTVEVYDDNKDVTPEKKVKQEPKIVEKPKIEEKKKIVEKSIVEKRPKKVEPVKEVKAKVEKREEKIREQPQSHKSEGSYYIQVGSFAQKPSSRFLSVISNSGFSYKLHPSGKLLIGSYSSRANAKRDLPRVKDRINKSAFVIRIK